MKRILAAGALCLVCAWLVPNHYPPWMNFHSEALAFWGLGVVAIAECLRVQSAATWHVPKALISFAFATVGLVWLQFFAGVVVYFGDALLVSLFISGLAVAITLGYRSAAADVTDLGLRWIFTSIAMAAMLSAIVGLMQWLDLEGVLGIYALEADVRDRPLGNLGQPNQLATLLVVGLISIVWIFSLGHGGGLFCVVCAAVLTLVLALTQSRAGILGAVTSCLFLIWKAHTAPGKLSVRYFLVWLLGFTLLLLFLPKLDGLLLIGGVRSAESLFAFSGRGVIWGQTLAAIGQSPWLGYGWLQTPAAQAMGSLTVPGVMIFTFSHNVVLDLLVWNGIPVGLLIAGLCAFWFASRMKKAKDNNAVCAMAAMLPMLVHSMVEYPFAYSYFLLTAGLMAGIVEATHPRTLSVSLSRHWLTVGLTAWFCIGSVMTYEYFQLETEYRMGRLVNEDLEPASSDHQPPSIHLLTQLDALVTAIRVQPTPNMPAAEIEKMRHVLSRFANRELHISYILALGLNGHTSEANHQLLVIRSMYGIRSFKIAQFVLREWQMKYPVLGLVSVPS